MRECSFTMTARPLGMLGIFTGSGVGAEVRILDLSNDGAVVGRCTTQARTPSGAPYGAICASLADPDLPLGTPLSCVVYTLPFDLSPYAGPFGCGAGL